MTNKELFIKTYNAYLQFESDVDILGGVGINLEDSYLNSAFYTLFEAIMNQVLTEEGNTILFEEMLFQGYSTDAAVFELEEYFI